MSTFKSLHKFYSSCFDDNGNFCDDKAKTIIKSYAYYGNDRLSLLKNIYDSVLSAKFVNKFARLYITNSNMTVRDIGNFYNEKLPIGGELVKEATSRSQISNCSAKINDIFYDIEFNRINYDIITWLLDSNTFRLDNDDEKKRLKEEFLGQLNNFIELYIDKPIIDKRDLIITLPICSKINKINQEEFEEFMNIIRPYSRHEMKMIQDNMGEYVDCVGYLKYIMSPKSELTDIDKENRSDVLRWLGKESDFSIELNKIKNNFNSTDSNDNEDDIII